MSSKMLALATAMTAMSDFRSSPRVRFHGGSFMPFVSRVSQKKRRLIARRRGR